MKNTDYLTVSYHEHIGNFWIDVHVWWCLYTVHAEHFVKFCGSKSFTVHWKKKIPVVMLINRWVAVEIQLYQDSIQACYIPWMDVDHQQVYGGDWSNCGHTRVSLIIIGKNLWRIGYPCTPITEVLWQNVRWNWTTPMTVKLRFKNRSWLPVQFWCITTPKTT